MSNNFKGVKYRTATNWFPIIPKKDFENKKIKYLEIGAFYGANVISVGKTYGSHPESELYCIDPWIEYNDYPEYKNKQENTYNTFLRNVDNSGLKDKIKIKRGFSDQEIVKFKDNFFDIIYIDGNHEPEYVLEDAVLSFRKLKVGGIMIFDDYNWNKGKKNPKLAIDKFLKEYKEKINILGIPPKSGNQVIIQKK